jgi:hypothetical protein
MVSIETILSVIVGLGTVGTSLYALFKVWRGRLHVRRLVTENDNYFEEALKLYDRHFDHWEKDEPEEIERWLKEAKVRRARSDRSLEEYLLTTIWKQRPCGFFYGTFYDSTSTLFVSYLVVDHGLDERIASRVSKKLLAAVQKQLKADGYAYARIVAEVEVPATAPTVKLRRKRRARIRCLLRISKRSDVPLRVLDAFYLQPKLDLRDKDKHEDPLLLLYARVGAEMPPALAREEVADLLQFIYGELYGDCFMEDVTLDDEWRQYTADLLERAISKLPESVRCLPKYEDISLEVGHTPNLGAALKQARER